MDVAVKSARACLNFREVPLGFGDTSLEFSEVPLEFRDPHLVIEDQGAIFRRVLGQPHTVP